MFTSFLCVLGVLGYDLFQLSSRDLPLPLGEASSITVPGAASQVETEDYLVSTWVNFEVPTSELVPFIVFVQDKEYSLDRVLFRLSKDRTGHFEVDVETESGDRFLTNFLGADTRDWEQITVRVSTSEGKVTFCTSLWQKSPTCVNQYVSRQLAAPHSDSSSSIHLAKSARSGHYKDTVSSGGILNARLILGLIPESEMTELMNVYQCAEACTAGCWGPGSSSCSDFVQLLHPQKSAIGSATWRLWDPQFFGHRLRDANNFALTGWFYLNEHLQGRTELFALHTRECEFRDSRCATVFVHITGNRELQTCLEVSQAPYILCLDAYLVEEKQWHFLSVAYCPERQVLELCHSTWEAATNCTSQDVSDFFLEKKAFEIVALGESETQVTDLRYYYHDCFTPANAEELREKNRKNCRRGCPMLTSVSDRRLTTATDISHYAILSAEISYSAGSDLYFTFENTHISTVWIYFQVEDLSNTAASYSAYLYKPWNATLNDYSWPLGSGRSFYYKLHPTDSEITRLGGLMTGSYTIRVVGPESGGLFFLEVKIACSSLTSACFCPVGTYPNLTPSSCAPCADHDIICTNASSLGCITANFFNVTQPYDTFNCYTAGNAQFFNTTNGYKYDCDSTCASCVGPENTQCASCYPSAELSTLSEPTTCRCSDGFIAVDTSANCLYWNSTCAEFDGSKCTGCYSHAVLAAEICQCADGWYPDPYPSNCQPCDPTCAKCTSSGATKCTACYSKATLVGDMVPSSCSCSDGFWLDPTSGTCSACDVSCYTCATTGPSQCLSCFEGASLQGVAPSSCACNSVWRPSARPNECKECDSTCFDCVDMTASGCIQCHPNAKLTSGYNSACECKRGYYPNTTAKNCTHCSDPCATCSVGGETQCLTCHLHASISGTAPNSCVCNTGWWPNPTPADCSVCSNSCLTCINQDISGCTQCYEHAELSAGSPSACVCTTGNLPLPDTSQCGVCYSTCVTCTHLGPSGCTTCWPNASLQAVAPSACLCRDNYYPNRTSANCALCDKTCLTCNGGSASHCLSCYSNAAVVSGACKCSIGYYRSPDTMMKCARCSQVCAFCEGPASTQCLTCYTGAELSGSTCLCKDGYFPDQAIARCIKCHATCLTCEGRSANRCLTCLANASPFYGNCVCNKDYYPTTSSADCAVCSYLCQTCGQNSQSCTSCRPHAELQPTNTCICSPGFFPNPDVSVCSACDPGCATCFGGTAIDCASCYSYAILEGVAPSRCICAAGYYPDATNGICAACDPTCLTCIDGTPHGCETCQHNAVLRGSAPNFCVCETGFYPNPSPENCITCASVSNNRCASCSENSTLQGPDPLSCVCNYGYYLDPTSTNCSLCSVLCTACSGPSSSECLICNSHASLQSTNSCLCNPGYWQDPSTGLCSACHDSCNKCINGAPDGCTECKSNATLARWGTAACICMTGYFPINGSAGNCAQCSSTCVSCKSFGVNKCTECHQNATLQNELEPSVCLCSLSFYPSPNSAACLPCHSTCSSCVSEALNQCDSCKPHAHLNGRNPSPCICDARYFPDPDASNCSQCAVGCARCQDLGNCSECDGGFGLFENKTCGACPLYCASCIDPAICKVCRRDYFLTTSGLCKDCLNCNESLTATATGPFGSTYKITFNRIVLQTFLQTDFSLSTKPVSALAWNVTRQDPLQLEVLGGPWKNGTLILIRFLTKVVDEFGYFLTTKELTIPAETTDLGVVATGLKAVIGTATVFAAMTGSGGLAMTSLSLMQYFSYIGVANYTLTGVTQAFYLSLDLKSAIPNLFQSSGKGESSRDFLDNAGSIFTLFLVIIIIHAVLIALDIALGGSRKLLRKVRKRFEWTVYLYFWYCAYLDLQVTALLDLKSAPAKSTEIRTMICLILASTTLMLTLLTPLSALLLIYKKQDILYTAELTPYRHQCSALISSLRTDVRWAKYVQVVYYFQRLLYSFLIVFCGGHKAYISEVMLIPALLMVVFVLAARPMRTKSLRVLQIIAEVDFFFVFVSLCAATLVYAVPDRDVCWMIVFLTVKTIVCTVVMTVIGAIGGVKDYLEKKKNQLIVQSGASQPDSARVMAVVKEVDETSEHFIPPNAVPPMPLEVVPMEDPRPVRMEDEPEELS